MVTGMTLKNRTAIKISRQHVYEGCSNMNASSLKAFFTYMLRQNVIPFWKELFVAFKMTPNIKKHSLFFRVTDPYIKAAPVY